MFSARWKQTFTEQLFVSTDEGYRIYFPFRPYPIGPLRGYVLTELAYESIIVTSHNWFNLISCALFIVTAVVGSLLNLNIEDLLLIGMIDYLLYYFHTRRIIGNLVALPLPISMEIYVRAFGPDKVIKQITFFDMMAIIFAFLAFHGNRSIIYGILSIYFAYTAYIRSKALNLQDANDTLMQ